MFQYIVDGTNDYAENQVWRLLVSNHNLENPCVDGLADTDVHCKETKHGDILESVFSHVDTFLSGNNVK